MNALSSFSIGATVLGFVGMEFMAFINEALPMFSVLGPA